MIALVPTGLTIQLWVADGGAARGWYDRDPWRNRLGLYQDLSRFPWHQTRPQLCAEASDLVAAAERGQSVDAIAE